MHIERRLFFLSEQEEEEEEEEDANYVVTLFSGLRQM
jgi:hypothetical protein